MDHKNNILDNNSTTIIKYTYCFLKGKKNKKARERIGRSPIFDLFKLNKKYNHNLNYNGYQFLGKNITKQDIPYNKICANIFYDFLDKNEKEINNEVYYYRQLLSASGNCPPNIIRKIYLYKNYNLNDEIARHKNTPINILQNLKDLPIILENPSCPIDILKYNFEKKMNNLGNATQKKLLFHLYKKDLLTLK
jgi:hypothetical protein